MSNGHQVLEADWTWIEGRLAPRVQVAVDEHGRIADVGALGLTPTRRLPGRCLLPGMINAHSHAFQRGLRGRGEIFPDDAGDFWSWRRAMYDLVTTLDGDELYQTCLRAFGEMLRAGITCVGEFHYLHHDGGQDFGFDRVVLRAARDAGIRLVLLETFYATGGFGRPLEPAQRRFSTPSLQTFFHHLAAIQNEMDPRSQSLGLAAHSVRAVPPEFLAPLHVEARARGLPLHIHLEEQQREIEECLETYGKRPITLLMEELRSANGITAVHCTHTPTDLLNGFRRNGGGICVCPLTEGNLGDGIPQLRSLLADQSGLSLGTDSNARISMLEEMRWLEYGQRWQTQTRGVLTDSRGSTATRLFVAATEGGAHMLHVNAGRIAPGCWADLMVVDPTTPSLLGIAPDDLMSGMVFGAGDDVITDVCVGGKWVETRRG